MLNVDSSLDELHSYLFAGSGATLGGVLTPEVKQLSRADVERKRKLAVAQESLQAIDALKELKERKNEH